MEEPPQSEEEKLRQKSLKYSVLDGTFCSMKIGMGESFFSAFAVFLKATTFQIGLLGSLPQAIGSLLQAFTTRLIRLFGSRKGFVCTSAALEIAAYALIAITYYLGRMRVYWLLLFICLYWIFSMVLGPAWTSWIGDLVKENERGKYFGKRNKITGFALFMAYLAGGYILQHFNHGSNTEYWGFVAIFALASTFRIISVYYLIRQHEPEYLGEHTTLRGFVATFKDPSMKNYGLLIGYLLLMNFGLYVSSPFFAAYMLYDLHYSYILFTIVNASMLITKFLFMPVWGRLADQFGTRKTLCLSGIMMPIIPLLWLFSTNTWYLIALQVYSGIMWAGFELASFNFLFDTTTREKRASCLSYYNMLNSAAIIAGALIGTAVTHIGIFWSNYHTAFLLSFILRYAASAIFLPRLKEVRKVEYIRYPHLLRSIISARPALDMLHSAIAFTKVKIRGNIK